MCHFSSFRAHSELSVIYTFPKDKRSGKTHLVSNRISCDGRESYLGVLADFKLIFAFLNETKYFCSDYIFVIHSVTNSYNILVFQSRWRSFIAVNDLLGYFVERLETIPHFLYSKGDHERPPFTIIYSTPKW